MKKKMLLCGTVLAVLPLLLLAREFPLEFKTLTASEAMSFPSGPGSYAPLSINRIQILKEPKAVSNHPIYGLLGGSSSSMAFRLDESKGDGQGYDQLIVDLNHNGDLTDDPVAMRIEETNSASGTAPRQPENARFGPIPAPDDRKISQWRPVYFAQMFLYARPGSARQDTYLGSLQLKAGWYLETVVEFDGASRKVGIVDADCNLHLGDVMTPTIYKSNDRTNWYFQNGDLFLVDFNNSGKFENSIGNPESVPFSPLLYLGAKPYKALLAADCKSLVLEPWTDPLAELSLQPQGEQVSGLHLAWEKTPGQWQLLQPGLENGKAKVPPGNYRLYGCSINAKTAAGDSLILLGYNRSAEGGIRFEAGSTAPLKCGPPLDIKVTSERDNRFRSSSADGSESFFGQILRSFFSSEQPLQQLIQASVTGAGGETYSSFLLEGKGGRFNQPPKPTFTITEGGKEVASGNMEFG